MDTVYILKANCGIIGVYKYFSSAIREKHYYEDRPGIKIEKWHIRQ